jgi:hypothetical protein
MLSGVLCHDRGRPWSAISFRCSSLLGKGSKDIGRHIGAAYAWNIPCANFLKLDRYPPGVIMHSR